MNIWNEVHQLFESDDGSLPDVYVYNLAKEELVEIYSWVLSLTTAPPDTYVWGIKNDKGILIDEIQNPALDYVQGKIQSFRHPLELFKFCDVEIPRLSIFIWESEISFDYTVDQDLIGGFRMQVGSLLIDTSIKNRLKKYEQLMLEK